MNKFLILVLGLVFSLNVSSAALAKPTVRIGELNEVNTISPDDLYMAGEEAIVTGDVTGDLYVVGGNVEVSGAVSGDVVVIGGKVEIKGKVGDDVRILGGEVQLSGTVGDDLLFGGGSLVVGSAALIGGDLWAAAGMVDMQGTVTGDLWMGGDKVKIGGAVNGNASLRIGEENTDIFGNSGHIKGKLEYWADKEITGLEKVAGEVVFHKNPVLGNRGFVSGAAFGAGISGYLFQLLAWLVLGGLIILLFPKFLPTATADLTKHWSKTLLLGGLVLFAVPFLILMFMITVIGLPVAFVLGLTYIKLLVLGIIPGAFAIGTKVLKVDESSKASLFGDLAIGLVAYLLIGLVPVVGMIGQIAILMMGVGCLCKEVWGLMAAKYK